MTQSRSRTRSLTHDDFREGGVVALAVGASTWSWIALVDVLAGHPFYTFELLGGIVAFTLLHALLNLAYGVAIVSTVHAAAREPSLIYGVGFGLFILEIAFVFATVALSNLGLGSLAWLRIFGASLLGVWVALSLVARRHPIGALLRRAEHER
jgi:hypothetical protein